MNFADIAYARLHSQQIIASKCVSVHDVVHWMGAIQAQDYAMAKWAVGVRLPDSAEQMIDDAIDSGAIIRTHVLRPTWHIVSSEDIGWILQLTAARIRPAVLSASKQVGLTPEIFNKGSHIIEQALSGRKHLTREEIAAELNKAGIATHDNRLLQLLLWAELDAIACSGTSRDGHKTYALFSERVKAKPFDKDTALRKLAHRYFTSHCPTTLKDFVWWSGLSVMDARRAYEMIKPGLNCKTIEGEEYLFTDTAGAGGQDNSVFLLPAYDEYMISYKDRSASLSEQHTKKFITANGLFKPIIVVNGQVAGIWKRTIKGNKVIVDIMFFEKYLVKTKKLAEQRAQEYAAFLDMKVEVNFDVYGASPKD